WPALDGLSVRWGVEADGKEGAATLVVEDRSSLSVRFPRPAGAYTSIIVNREDGRGEEARFSYGDFADGFGLHYRSSNEVVRPGGSYRKRISIRDASSCLGDADPFRRPGNYSVTYETVFEFLFGERDGPEAGRSPVRLPVQARKVFTMGERGPSPGDEA